MSFTGCDLQRCLNISVSSFKPIHRGKKKVARRELKHKIEKLEVSLKENKIMGKKKEKFEVPKVP